jgi:hypothetical protein
MHTANELITHLNDEVHGVQHPVVTVSPITSSSVPDRGMSLGMSHKTSAEQYSQELKKIRDQKSSEYKHVQSKEYWQKFHDEFGRHH